MELQLQDQSKICFNASSIKNRPLTSENWKKRAKKRPKMFFKKIFFLENNNMSHLYSYPSFKNFQTVIPFAFKHFFLAKKSSKLL